MKKISFLFLFLSSIIENLVLYSSHCSFACYMYKTTIGACIYQQKLTVQICSILVFIFKDRNLFVSAWIMCSRFVSVLDVCEFMTKIFKDSENPNKKSTFKDSCGLECTICNATLKKLPV